MSPTNGNDPPSVQTDARAIAPKLLFAPVPWLYHLGNEIYASVKPDSSRDRVSVANAINGETVEFSTMLGETVKLQHIVMHPAESQFKTGEMYRRIILKCDDGTLISCGAQGVFESLLGCLAVHGPPPWRNCPVKLKQRKTGHGNNWPYLEILETDDVPSDPSTPGQNGK